MAGTTSIPGLGSGLDISGLIESLVGIEKTQQTAIKNKVTAHQTTLSVYQSLNTKIASIKTASSDLNIALDWKVNKATSSDASVTATADSSALGGSFSFVVKSLAQAQVAASYGTVASTDTVVGTGSLLLGQTGALGIKNITGAGLSTGSHTIEVSQASAGASLSGSVLGNSITLNGTETLNVNIDGVAQSLTLTAGTYDQASLAKMITTVSGGKLDATVNADKSLKLTTTHEGSAASLQITGGSGLSALGLTAGGTVNGTNGVVKVDGVSNTVTSVKPDGSNSVVLNGSAGTITATFGGGLRVGTSTVKNIDLGDGKLSTVVSAINAANVGVTAGAIQVAPNQYKLQLQSTATGSAGAIGTNFNAFAGTLGSIDTVTAAQDAVLQVGSGASAYEIKSSSNTVKGAMPGVTLNLSAADPTKTITVNVSGDASALADKVEKMVKAVNDVLSYIKSNSAYNAETKKGGPLLGNSTARTLQQQVMSAMSNIVSGADLKSMGAVGMKVAEDGTISFDKTKFTTAYQENPNAVAGLFVEGGLSGTWTGTMPGIAERVLDVATKAVDAVTGSITAVIKGENSTIADLNKQISAWDLRLENYRNRLTKQFTAMDVAVSQYNSMSSWLSGQIAGLPGSS